MKWGSVKLLSQILRFVVILTRLPRWCARNVAVTNQSPTSNQILKLLTCITGFHRLVELQLARRLNETDTVHRKWQHKNLLYIGQIRTCFRQSLWAHPSTVFRRTFLQTTRYFLGADEQCWRNYYQDTIALASFSSSSAVSLSLAPHPTLAWWRGSLSSWELPTMESTA